MIVACPLVTGRADPNPRRVGREGRSRCNGSVGIAGAANSACRGVVLMVSQE